jgi:hypothetical protein
MAAGGASAPVDAAAGEGAGAVVDVGNTLQPHKAAANTKPAQRAEAGRRVGWNAAWAARGCALRGWTLQALAGVFGRFIAAC